MDLIEFQQLFPVKLGGGGDGDAAPCAQHPMQPVGGHDDERLRPAAAVAAVPQCAVQAVVRAVLTDPAVPQ